MNSYRSILVSKIKFYEKMARKTRKAALKSWSNGEANFGAYDASLTVADNYDHYVMEFAKVLKEYDEELERPQ